MEHTPPTRAVSVVLEVTEDGRIIIPAQALRDLGIGPFIKVIAEVIDGELVLSFQ
jgi:bifunctional DNA-binding transcriptional regulator/antitoxin component of YhaV-PrlF toxin-antitoxin module